MDGLINSWWRGEKGGNGEIKEKKEKSQEKKTSTSIIRHEKMKMGAWKPYGFET